MIIGILTAFEMQGEKFLLSRGVLPPYLGNFAVVTFFADPF